MDSTDSEAVEQLVARLERVVAPMRVMLATLGVESADGDGVVPLAAAAERVDASPELKALAKAVREGVTTWDDVVAGKAEELTELATFYDAMYHRTRRLLADLRHAADTMPKTMPRTMPKTRPEPKSPARREPVPVDDEVSAFDEWRRNEGR